MTDLAWASESWLAVRLHVSPSALGDKRDLLAASLSGTAMDGSALQASAPLLQLPVVDSQMLATLPLDETAANRLLELEFAKASEALRLLARQEDAAAVKKALAAMEKRFGQHTWLRAKMEQLRHLAQDDMQMMAKEVHFSIMRMSRRLVARDEAQFGMDETSAKEVPAFLRKKVSEGRGRKPG